MIETTSLPTPADSLTQQEVAAFTTGGFLGPKAILTPAQCALVMRYLRLDQHPSPPDWHKARGASEPLIFDLGTYPPLIVWLRQLLGPDIVLWGATIVERKPGQTHHWHTDIETSAPDARAISVWIGLEHVSRRSALQVVPGSHRFGKPIQHVAHERGLRRDDLSEETALKLAQAYDASTSVVQADMADGQGLLFDGRIWHGSHNSDDTSVRTALLLQYAAADAAIHIPDFAQLEWPFRFLDRPRPPCVVVAGARPGEANRLVPPPSATQSGARLLTELHQLPRALQEDLKRGWRPYPQFNGSTPIVSEMGCHVSVLSGGCSPHPPHVHLEEEVLLLLEGEAELIIPSGPDDQTPRIERLFPGSFVYYPAYQCHTLRNPLHTPMTYLMFKWKAAPDEIRQPLSARVVHLPRAGSQPPRQAFNVEMLFEGPTAFLGNLHAHVSELQPGAGYAPHADAHDVAIVVLSGQIETQRRRLKARSVVYFAAGEQHGMKNSAAEPARYLVFEFHAPRLLVDRGGDVRDHPPIARDRESAPRTVRPSLRHRAAAAERSILIVSDHEFFPDRCGGRESSIHELACLFQRAGYRVAVLAKQHPLGAGPGVLRTNGGLVHRVLHLTAGSISRRLKFYGDRFTWRSDYPVIRTHDVVGHMDELLKRGSYERAIVNIHRPHEMLDLSSSQAHRYLVYIRDVEDLNDMDPTSFPSYVTVVATSRFCADRLASQIGRRVPAIEPYVERSNYVTASTGKYVTFVNPVEVKGLDIAVNVARACPDIPFLFLEGWPQLDHERERLRSKLAGLPNVTWRRRVRNMRGIYRQTRVLFVPSQWQEAWGRVVVEAQFSGIPAVASNVGGLVENVGQAGLVLDAGAPTAAWVDAIRAVWSDRALHKKLSECAHRKAGTYWKDAAVNALTLADLSNGRRESSSGTGADSRDPDR
jgi:glycosyltransferase involved in cell wall biosynthesis/mannose-6-phosphate isomerase-like protein (cupin superfamily)